MGSDDPNVEDDEKPVHTVYIDAFYMDKYEVTNSQYQEFVHANLQWQKDRLMTNCMIDATSRIGVGMIIQIGNQLTREPNSGFVVWKLLLLESLLLYVPSIDML